MNIKKTVFILILSVVLCGCTGQVEKEKNQEVNAVIKIACVGDSITQGVGALNWQSGDKTYAYPNQLSLILGEGYEVGNFGKGSSYIYNKSGRDATLWYPNTEEYRLSNEFGADIVVIMLGSNDARVIYNEEEAYEWKLAFKELIKHYKELEGEPDVYILSTLTHELYDSLKRANNPDFKLREPIIKDYIVPYQRQAAEEMNCGFIDTYSLLYELLSSGKGFASDSLHLNNLGYQELAMAVAENLDI